MYLPEIVCPGPKNRIRQSTCTGRFYAVANTMTRMHRGPFFALLGLVLWLPACAHSDNYRVVDGTDGAARKPGHVRVALLHLGAKKSGRETEESALADLAFNTGEAEKLIRIAAERGAQLVVTPEYGNTGNLIPERARPWLSTCVPMPNGVRRWNSNARSSRRASGWRTYGNLVSKIRNCSIPDSRCGGIPGSSGSRQTMCCMSVN